MVEHGNVMVMSWLCHNHDTLKNKMSRLEKLILSDNLIFKVPTMTFF